jgi:hypothetical protein
MTMQETGLARAMARSGLPDGRRQRAPSKYSHPPGHALGATFMLVARTSAGMELTKGKAIEKDVMQFVGKFKKWTNDANSEYYEKEGSS